MRGHQMDTYLKHITPTPWLMLVDEVSASVYTPVFEMGSEPKGFGVAPGGHFGVLDGAERERVMAASLDFLRRRLDL